MMRIRARSYRRSPAYAMSGGVDVPPPAPDVVPPPSPKPPGETPPGITEPPVPGLPAPVREPPVMPQPLTQHCVGRLRHRATAATRPFSQASHARAPAAVKWAEAHARSSAPCVRARPRTSR